MTLLELIQAINKNENDYSKIQWNSFFAKW